MTRAGFETYSEPSISTSSNSPLSSFFPFPSSLSLSLIFAKNECEKTQVLVDSGLSLPSTQTLDLLVVWIQIGSDCNVSSKLRLSLSLVFWSLPVTQLQSSDTKSVHLSTEMDDGEGGSEKKQRERERKEEVRKRSRERIFVS